MIEAIRHDANKIELYHIHPNVWVDELAGNVADRDLISLSNDMDRWFYYGESDKISALMLLNVPENSAAMCAVLAFGSKKYASLNYCLGMNYSRVLNSFRRHLLAIVNGEVLDPESGLPHLGHLYCNVLFAKTYILLGYDGGKFDDRPTDLVNTEEK